MRALIFLVLFYFSVTSYSAVWESNQDWNNSWKERYSNWVATEVNSDFFKSHPSAPFRALNMDCADVQYALIAYFSRMNRLNFRVNNGNTTNKTSRFDHIQGADQRMAAFINHLKVSFGTESLAHVDTYPIAVTDIHPGDIYMYKVGSGENVIRHTYIIKNINIDGTFDVFYSTQERMNDGRPPVRIRSYVFKKAPLNTGVDKNHWGFRRQKPSGMASISQEDLSLSDFSQYELARHLGRRGFNQKVVELNRGINESPNQFAQRNFAAVCLGVQTRVDSVNAALKRKRELGGACMNYRDYDAYSTPSRDSGIKDDYLNYFEGLKGKQRKLNRENNSLFAAVFARNTSSSNETLTYRNCRVDTAIGPIYLNPFKTALFAGMVSFHPNDTIQWRWGKGRGLKTSCQEYYGYPVD